MFFTYYFSIPWISSLCDRTFFFLSEIRSIIGHRNSSFHLLFHLFSVSSMNREFAGEGQQLHHLFTCKRLGFKNSFNPWNTSFLGVKHFVSLGESTYKKCLREEWGKFTGNQLLSSFWLKVARTDEDRNTTRWDRGTLPIRNLYPQWWMLRFGRIRKVTNWIWILWFIVSY